MSAESSDCEQISEWTLVNASGDDEDPSIDLATRGSTIGEDTRDLCSTEETTGGAHAGHFQLESKLCEIFDVLKDKEDGLLPKSPSKESSEASDIERISDDGMESINYSMEGSVISHISTFSLLNAPESMDGDTESISGSSGISVIQEDGAQVRPTNYTHTPNRKLNFTLNLLLVLSVTMVVGLGIGHFIGWSSRWMHARQIHQAHIAKLKALQGELVDCLQNPSSYYLETNGESKACYEKVDYWKKKFEDMLLENRVLQEFVDRTMHKADLDDDDDDKCEEANKNIVAEYRQLKFHLIMQQLENVATLRQVEALKNQEMETLYRMKQLEEENEELKAQVEEELHEDAAKEAEEKAVMAVLAAENQELKQELDKLMATLKLEKEDDEKKTTEKLWPLRQQINQLEVENSELKQVIAKLRYGKPPVAQDVKKQEKMTPPPQRSRFANREPPQKPDNALHSWLVDNMKKLNLTDFIEYLTKVAMDKEAARRELTHLEENLKLSYEQLSEKAKHGIDTGKTLLSDLQKNLHSKLEQIMNVDPSDIALPIEHIQKVGKTLKKTVEKMYEIGMDMLNTKQEDGPENDGNHKFQKQVDKLMAKFGTQWENIKSSVWGVKLTEDSGDAENPGEEMIHEDSINAENPGEEMIVEHEKPNDDIFVATSREDHEKGRGVSNEDWAKKSEKEKKDEKNKRDKGKQIKTAIKNGEEKLQPTKYEKTKESEKTEKPNRDKKNKNKEDEKFRKSYNERVSDDESSEVTEETKKAKHEDEDIPKKKSQDENAKNKKKSKNEKTKMRKNDDDDDDDEDEKEEKYKKNHEDGRVKTSKRDKKSKKHEKSKKRENSETKENRKDKSKEFKQKEKRDNDLEDDEDDDSKSKVNKHKNRKMRKNHREKQKNEKSSSKSKKSKEEKSTKAKTNKSKNGKRAANHTKFSDEHSGDWMFQRAEERTTKRKSKHQSDWLFERAYDRENIRREAQRSEWYFMKNRRDEEPSYDESKKSSDDKGAAKSNKKANKMRKNQWQENEHSSDEDMWHEHRNPRHAYRYAYNVDWAMPDYRAYYSS